MPRTRAHARAGRMTRSRCRANPVPSGYAVTNPVSPIYTGEPVMSQILLTTVVAACTGLTIAHNRGHALNHTQELRRRWCLPLPSTSPNAKGVRPHTVGVWRQGQVLQAHGRTGTVCVGQRRQRLQGVTGASVGGKPRAQGDGRVGRRADRRGLRDSHRLAGREGHARQRI